MSRTDPLKRVGEAKDMNGEIPGYRSFGWPPVSLLEGDEHTRYWKLPDAAVDAQNPACRRYQRRQERAESETNGKGAANAHRSAKPAVLPVDCEAFYYRARYDCKQIGRSLRGASSYTMVVLSNPFVRSPRRGI